MRRLVRAHGCCNEGPREGKSAVMLEIHERAKRIWKCTIAWYVVLSVGATRNVVFPPSMICVYVWVCARACAPRWLDKHEVLPSRCFLAPLDWCLWFCMVPVVARMIDSRCTRALVCAFIFRVPVFLKQDVDLVPGPCLSQEGLRRRGARWSQGHLAVTVFNVHVHARTHTVLRTHKYAATTRSARAGNKRSRHGWPDTSLTACWMSLIVFNCTSWGKCATSGRIKNSLTLKTKLIHFNGYLMVKVVEKTLFFLQCCCKKKSSLCDITKTADTSVIPETQKILKTFFSKHVEGLFLGLKKTAGGCKQKANSTFSVFLSDLSGTWGRSIPVWAQTLKSERELCSHCWGRRPQLGQEVEEINLLLRTEVNISVPPQFIYASVLVCLTCRAPAAAAAHFATTQSKAIITLVSVLRWPCDHPTLKHANMVSCYSDEAQADSQPLWRNRTDWSTKTLLFRR